MSDSTQQEDKFPAIVRRLNERTLALRVDWTTTDKESAYLYTGESFSVIIDGYRDRDGDQRIELKLLNQRGTEVESLHSTFTPGEYAGTFLPGPNNELLESLYAGARRNALRLDEVLDAILRDLGEE